MIKPISEIRKPEIVRGAIQALNKNGLSMVSYDTVAEESDMSRQLIRHYFPDVDSLLDAMCQTMANDFRDALTRGVMASESKERLSTILDILFDMPNVAEFDRPQNTKAYDAMMSIATHNDTVRSALYDQHSILQATLDHEICLSYPELPRNGCQELAYLCVAQLYGHMRMVKNLGFSPKLGKVARQSVDRLIASYVEAYDDPDLGDDG